MTRQNFKRFFAGSAIGLACFVALNLASAQSSRTWNGSVNNDWFNAGNWTPGGVPASNDTVNFSSGTINLTAPITIGGQFNWSGGTLSGSDLTIASNGVLNISGSVTLDNALTNGGTVNWLGGDLFMYTYFYPNAGPVVNLAGGVWNIQCDQTLSSWNGAGVNAYFQNAGTVQKSAGTNTTSISLPFYNTGAVAALRGTLNFQGGATVEGTFSAATNTVINFAAGSFSSTLGAVLNGPGSIQFTGGNLALLGVPLLNLPLVGGTVSLGPNFEGGTITNLTLAGSTLSSASTVSGVMNWTAGIVVAPVTIASNGVLNISGSVTLDNALTNGGTVNWLGGDLFMYTYFYPNAGPVVNLAGGVWNIQCDQTLSSWNGAGVNAYFQNAGTVQKSAGTNTTSISLPFYNTGAVAALRGTLNFQGGATVEGTFSAATNTVINFAAGSFSSTLGAVLNGPGSIQFTGGNLALLGVPLLNLPLVGGTVSLGPNFEGGTITNLTLAGSTLSSASTVSGVMNWTAGIVVAPVTIASNGVLNISGSVTLDNALTNGGTVNWLGGDVFMYTYSYPNAGPVVNLAGGVWNIQCDQTLSSWNGAGANAYFQNAGTVRKSAGMGATYIQIAFYNSGLVGVESGTISFNGGGTLVGTFAGLSLTSQGNGAIAPFPDQPFLLVGSMVTLTARPLRYYSFVRWSDGVTNNPRDIIVAAQNPYTAIFTTTSAIPLETLAIGSGTRIAPVGAPVVLLNGQWYSNNVVLATNGTHYSVQLQSSFANASFFFTTDGSDPEGSEPYAGPFDVTAPFSIRVVAYSEDFSQAVEADAVSSMNLTIPAIGSILSTPQTDPYTGAASVNLAAVPNAGWTFLNWTGDASGTNTNTNVVVDGPKTAGAVFGTGLTTSGGGLVQRQPALTLYPYGSTVRLTAVPTNATTYFRSWSGDALGQVVNPLNYVVTKPNTNVIAAFLTLPANTHSLTVLINGDGSVTKTPQQSNYTHNASVTLTATPAAGSFFVNWTGDTNSALDPVSVVMNTNKTITATFRSSVVTPPSVTITNPLAGTVFTAPVNIPITASASTGSVALASVAFYGGTNLLSTVSNAPYTCTWTNAPIGTNVLSAIALDDSGLSATSAPVSITVLPSPPVFHFSAAIYQVNENAGSVTLTVLNSGDLGGSVSFQTVDGTAQGGTGFSGDYTITSSNLTLGAHQATIINIPILDNFLDRPDIQFQVQLLFPSPGALLGSPATATVTIHENDVGGATNSLLTVALPGPQPPMNGQLTVTLAPPEANGQWRFPWDLGWRTNGQTVTGLVPGDYPLEFRSSSNYLAYPPTVTITVPNNGTVSYTNQYYPTFPPEGTNETCSLTVNIGPNAPPGAGWRFRGETAGATQVQMWLASCRTPTSSNSRR